MTTKILSDDMYYNIEADLAAYPEAWCYVIIGGRNTGKTYSTLKYYLNEHLKIVFCKRTNDDIDTLCAGNTIGKKGAEYEVDFSPYKAINRDLGTNVKAYKIKHGLGGFYRSNEEGEASGSPVAYMASLFAVSKIKGFDMSDAEAVVFDEFIPQPWDRVNRKEGEQLMDLYKTVARDKYERTGKELKLILLANAVNVWNPTAEILEIIDTITNMCAKSKELLYDPERRILIRVLKTPEKMIEKEKKTGLYKTMAGTAWGRMAFGNEFGYNDFSQIKQLALKGFRPIVSVENKGKSWYIYCDGTKWYMTDSQAPNITSYDLNTESGQKAFYYDYVLDLQEYTIENRMFYKTYTMYDMIVNYKKRFTV